MKQITNKIISLVVIFSLLVGQFIPVQVFAEGEVVEPTPTVVTEQPASPALPAQPAAPQEPEKSIVQIEAEQEAARLAAEQEALETSTSSSPTLFHLSLQMSDLLEHP